MQGPFSGRNMSVWYRADYIDSNVKVKREGEEDFWKIGDDAKLFVQPPKPPSPSSLPSSQWFYLDDDGAIQGPFPTSHMKSWFEQGFITASVSVRKDGDNQFAQLCDYEPLPDFLDAPIPKPQVNAEDQLWYYIDVQGIGLAMMYSFNTLITKP